MASCERVHHDLGDPGADGDAGLLRRRARRRRDRSSSPTAECSQLTWWSPGSVRGSTPRPSAISRAATESGATITDASWAIPACSRSATSPRGSTRAPASTGDVSTGRRPATRQPSPPTRSSGQEAPRFLESPPYFWTDQPGLKIQLLGWPELADRQGWLDIDDVEPKSAYGWHRGDELVAAAVLGKPRLFVKFRKELIATGHHLAGIRAVRRRLTHRSWRRAARQRWSGTARPSMPSARARSAIRWSPHVMLVPRPRPTRRPRNRIGRLAAQQVALVRTLVARAQVRPADGSGTGSASGLVRIVASITGTSPSLIIIVEREPPSRPSTSSATWAGPRSPGRPRG